MVEATLLVPFLIFLFLAVFDFGFYCYDLIAVENAARAAVLATSAGSDTANDRVTACNYAFNEMRSVTNISPLDPATFRCLAAPLQVNATPVTDATGATIGSRVDITYTSELFFKLPFFPSQLIITRTAEARVTGES